MASKPQKPDILAQIQGQFDGLLALVKALADDQDPEEFGLRALDELQRMRDSRLPESVPEARLEALDRVGDWVRREFGAGTNSPER